ncbi:hypothetical protein [Candidatus Binatus sp.]|uniref:hypothetical protein n=1 Tax=Candidatus Binatus sp. TaxID=2811406 RepID=UPI003CA1B986
MGYRERSFGNSNLIGFSDESDIRHANSVAAANERPARQMEIRWLAPLFVLSADEQLRTRAQAAITAFPSDLPFESEEEKADEARIAWLRRTAEIWSELGKPGNYHAVQAEDGSGLLIKMESPAASDPDVIAGAQRMARMNEQLTLLSWARMSLESGALSAELSLPDALLRAKATDRRDLFTEPHGGIDDASMARNAVAGISAAVLLCAGEIDLAVLDWATDVTLRACKTPEKYDATWFAGSKHLDHPCLFAVDGVLGLIRRGIDQERATGALLELGGHALEEVSEKAIGAGLSLWETDTKLAWAALNLGIQLSIGSSRISTSPYGDNQARRDRVGAAVQHAVKELCAVEPRTSLPDVPPAWIFAPRPLQEDTFSDGSRSSEPIWRDPDEFLRWDFLPKVLAKIPIPQALADSESGPALRAFSYQLLDWTNERLSPSWMTEDAERKDHRSMELLDWRRQLCWFLGRLALVLDPEEVRRRILGPIFAHEDEIAASLISPLASVLATGGIMDALTVSINAIQYLQACEQRILMDRAWEMAHHRDGRIFEHDLPSIVRVLMFATGLQASGSVRFANGDWREVGVILPLTDPLIRSVGDISLVMFSFLTLCENAIEHYPAAVFVDQIAVVLNMQEGMPIGWRGTSIPSRIAALVHAFAEMSQPLPTLLAQGMLRVLDRLVDMGDRRSAALQTSEIFKDVRHEESRSLLKQNRGINQKSTPN